MIRLLSLVLLLGAMCSLVLAAPAPGPLASAAIVDADMSYAAMPGTGGDSIEIVIVSAYKTLGDPPYSLHVQYWDEYTGGWKDMYFNYPTDPTASVTLLTNAHGSFTFKINIPSDDPMYSYIVGENNVTIRTQLWSGEMIISDDVLPVNNLPPQ